MAKINPNYTSIEKKLDNLAIAEVAKEKPEYIIRRCGKSIKKQAAKYRCVNLCKERLDNLDFFFKTVYHVVQSPVTLMTLFGIKYLSK